MAAAPVHQHTLQLAVGAALGRDPTLSVSTLIV